MTLLRRLQPERGYCSGDSGGDPGREHCREVSEARRFLPGPWPRVVTGCRDRGAGPRPAAPSPHPCAFGGAPSREGGPLRPCRLRQRGGGNLHLFPVSAAGSARASATGRRGRPSARAPGGGPIACAFFPRAHRGGARPLANRRERGGCSALRSEDGPRDRTARSASAGYVSNTGCPRARSSLISAVLLSPLGKAEERRVLGVGGSVRATRSHREL